MDIEILSLNDHVRKYMADLPSELRFGTSPIQVFRLENIVKYLKYPTPLLKPQYNLLLHITGGSVTIQVGLDKFKLRNRCTLLILSNRTFARHYVSKNLTGFCTILQDSALTKLLNKQQLTKLFSVSPVINFTNKTNSIVTRLNAVLAEEFSELNYNAEFVQATLQSVFIKMLQEANTGKAMSRQDEVAFLFKQLVYTHYAKQSTPAFYAHELHVSENYLTRCVKNAFGKAPKTIITEVIVQHTQILLLETTLDIAGIAYKLNFSDPSYFARLFKKLTGYTPSAYREKHMHI